MERVKMESASGWLGALANGLGWLGALMTRPAGQSVQTI